MNHWSYTGLAILVVFLAGCETAVKRDPVPVSSVRFLEARSGWVFSVEPIKSGSVAYSGNRQLHHDYHGRPDCVLVYHFPVTVLAQKAQYVGRITWSGTIPEADIPESRFNDLSMPVPVQFPERIQVAVREEAAKKGGNMVVLSLDGANYYWHMEGGKLQPDFLLFGKAYYLTNAP